MIVEKKVEVEKEKRVEVPVQVIREVPVEVVKEKECSCCSPPAARPAGAGQQPQPGPQPRPAERPAMGQRLPLHRRARPDGAAVGHGCDGAPGRCSSPRACRRRRLRAVRAPPREGSEGAVRGRARGQRRCPSRLCEVHDAPYYGDGYRAAAAGRYGGGAAAATKTTASSRSARSGARARAPTRAGGQRSTSGAPITASRRTRRHTAPRCTTARGARAARGAAARACFAASLDDKSPTNSKGC